MQSRWTRRNFLASTGAVAVAGPLFAPAVSWAAPGEPPEDGYDLWLRYRLVDHTNLLATYRRAFTEVVRVRDMDVLKSAEAELVRGLSGLLGRTVDVVSAPSQDGAVVVGTPETSAIVREHVSRDELAGLGPEGHVLRRTRVDEMDVTLVASNANRGVLYGAFHLLRLLQTQRAVGALDVSERPANPVRMINHWDNLNRSVERGYAGQSIFQWDDLPELDERYTDYARALASVGINATVVNNVNANADFLSSDRLPGLAALASVLRQWGVTFFLSANYASPITLTRGEPEPIDTADPFDARVQAWWRDKVNEIYEHIPDFGGFLVKANSEGQPGPLDYGRTHADGANMLAGMVAPHGGRIVWRSFVHEGFSDWAEYQHNVFAPLDGDFADNVAVQTKNGPIDFQVREPVNPLFGALPNTNQMIELQITQEYTGQSTHLCYLVPQWKEVLAFDTMMNGAGTTVASIVDGSAYGQSNVGFAGVVNFGDDRNWTGHHLAAANTHGFARLAWNPALRAEEIAEEWVRMTFGSHAQQVQMLVRMLTSAWEIYESYTVPLGIGGHMVVPGGAHFEPNPRASEGLSHHTDAVGTGFDRTIATGTGYPGLYHDHWAQLYESLDTCPDELLLFMHKVPYGHVLHSGKTVIQHIYDSHFTGVDDAYRLRRVWVAQKAQIDARRHREVLERFDRQVEHATKWRDAIVGYFFERSRILDEQREWLQIDPRGTASLVFGGWPNRVQLDIGNASGDDRTVRAQVVAPNEQWSTSAAERSIPSVEFGTIQLPVLPPLAAQNVTLDLDIEADDLETLGATGREYVVTPAARRCLIALDAGPSGSPLVSDYDRLTPETMWDQARGYGWVGSSPQSRDRGGSLDALRRDFVNDIPARTLRLAVPAGEHDVAVLIGDGDPDSQPTFITVDDQLVAESPFLPGGTFTWLHFTLDGGADGRETDLVFDSLPDEHWHLGALVIADPSSALPEVVFTHLETDQPFWSGRDATLEVSVVNTTSEQSVPITIEVDAPDGWVAEPVNHELAPGVDETIPVRIRTPEQPSLAVLRVTVTSDAADVGDASRELDVIAVPTGDSVSLALDAGGPGGPVLDGYALLSPESEWNAESGFGWVDTTPESRDRGQPDVVRRDLVFGRPPGPAILRLAVPAGQHRVHVLTGDAFAISSETVVRVDGTVVGRSGESTIPQGSFRWFDFVLDGGNGGRIIDLELTGNLYERFWRIVALVVD